VGREDFQELDLTSARVRVLRATETSDTDFAGGEAMMNMVGLVVAAHGRLADELVATAEQIVGKLPNVATCSIEAGASPAQIREKMKSVICSVDSGDGVIVMADLFGGTPCKESLNFCRQRNLEVLAGVNLPMLLKANSLRAEMTNLDLLAHTLARHAQKNITCASDLVRNASLSEPARTRES
jgi:mannose PTS system EIIA component